MSTMVSYGTACVQAIIQRCYDSIYLGKKEKRYKVGLRKDKNKKGFDKVYSVIAYSEQIAIHKVLKITGAKHRSWQTHSLLFTGGFCFLLFALVFFGNALIGVTNPIDWACLRLATIGFIAGVASHLILDALSMAGIHIWPGFKLRFVPKSTAFKTGGKWETIVFYVLIVILCLLIGKIFVIDIIEWIKGLSFNLDFLDLDLGIDFEFKNEILKNLFRLE